MTIKSNSIRRSITACMIATFFWTTFFYCPHHFFSIILAAILGIILTQEWKNIFKVSNPLHWIVMPLYPITPFIVLIQLNESSEYRILVYYLFIIVFLFDTASYIFGTIFGKHTIVPSVSPGKTWEGVAGGYLVITATLIIMTWNRTYSFYTICLLSMILCTLAFAGDIFESYLKRQAGIKDSGNLLPGHGGFLDRFDAIMAVTLFFFYYKNYLIAFFVA